VTDVSVTSTSAAPTSQGLSKSLAAPLTKPDCGWKVTGKLTY
jgi:hypothetical protein